MKQYKSYFEVATNHSRNLLKITVKGTGCHYSESIFICLNFSIVINDHFLYCHFSSHEFKTYKSKILTRCVKTKSQLVNHQPHPLNLYNTLSHKIPCNKDRFKNSLSILRLYIIFICLTNMKNNYIRIGIATKDKSMTRKT